MKRLAAWLLLCCLSLLFTVPVSAHPGKTDASGGHYNHSTGEYHYHHGFPAHQHTNGVCPYDLVDVTSASEDQQQSSESMRVGPPVTGTEKSIRAQYQRRLEQEGLGTVEEQAQRKYKATSQATLDDIQENYQRIVGKALEESSEEYKMQIEQLQTALYQADKEVDTLYRILIFETAAVVILAVLFIGFFLAAHRRKKKLNVLLDQLQQQSSPPAGLQKELEESPKATPTSKRLQRRQAKKHQPLTASTMCSKCGNIFSGDLCPNCGTPVHPSPKDSPPAKAISQKAAPKKRRGTGMKVFIWIFISFALIILNIYIGMTIGIRLGQFLLDVVILWAGRKLCKLWDRHLEKKFALSSQGAEQENQRDTVYQDDAVYIHLTKVTHDQRAGQFFLNATLDMKNKSTAPLSLSYVLFDSTGREISPSEVPPSLLPPGDTSTTIEVCFRPPVSSGTIVVTANTSVAAFDFTI